LKHLYLFCSREYHSSSKFNYIDNNMINSCSAPTTLLGKRDILKSKKKKKNSSDEYFLSDQKSTV
jgi:hypothetical protein